ncbi:DNA-directed RNA polymerase subunit omega [Catellicoccus marimammalium]|uniref:DNA-directed RNA polymerase subunit omega n=1 Tax=Catellicoccus marimammalium M35/04/3 TaxID=1234409 RepID=K8ZA18_9ENTE|nr:DNA-directed RNA polymerase subunit omega [Catellicoccus marimammalium]EKU27899.1 DNA-directed RNA polymerase omega subunit [Catellicoccus marimammalium M35/04/3]
MMLKPSIDLLLDRVDSKYSLVILSAKRAHELDNHARKMLQHYESYKSVGKALEEIAAGDVTIYPNPELKREMVRRQEQEAEMMRQHEEEALEERVKLDSIFK